MSQTWEFTFEYELKRTFVLDMVMLSISLFLIITVQLGTFYPPIEGLPFDRPITTCTTKDVCTKIGRFNLCVKQDICTQETIPVELLLES